MAKEILKLPGVYVEELKFLPPSISQVETAVPVFIGYTEKDDSGGQPSLISSLADYETLFGTASAQDIQVKITDETTDPITIELIHEGGLVRSLLYYSLQLFYFNGGGKAYVVSAGLDTEAVTKEGLLAALQKSESRTECTLVVIPDAVRLANPDFFEVSNAILDQCERLRDRFAILDVKPEETAGTAAIDVFRNGITADTTKLRFGAAYHPYLQTKLPLIFSEERTTDVATGESLAEIKDKNEVRYKQIKKALETITLTLPPGGAIAGVYTAIDNSKGVWKAPVNVLINAVTRPSIAISNRDQESLNVDVISGKSINAIRFFEGKGTFVWGARTLAGNDNEWRYISVKRFFIMVEESVKKAVAGFCFEPNEATTWVKVKGMIENFLTQLWREGALMGTKPEHGFYVKVGLLQTMTEQDILNGNMIVEIGMAVVRPAEFILLRFSQKMQQP